MFTCSFTIMSYTGVLLYFVNSAMKNKTLCQLFGVTEGTISTALKSRLKLALKTLELNSEVAIVWPNNASKAKFASLIHRREPLISNAFGL